MKMWKRLIGSVLMLLVLVSMPVLPAYAEET